MTDVQDLFAQHFDGLHRYLTRFTGDGDLAADLAQETFIRWVEREPDGSNPKSWLYTVATNLARDHVRVHSRRLALLRDAPDSITTGDRPLSAHEAMEAAERQRFVREALGALPERERSMLLMQQEGFSHQEIAEATGTTTKSVGTYLSRAARKLAKQLTPLLERIT
jgi:RNA polymerase sigma factor (sigma-70 family)